MIEGTMSRAREIEVRQFLIPTCKFCKVVWKKLSGNVVVPEQAQVYTSIEVYYSSGTLNSQGVVWGVHISLFWKCIIRVHLWYAGGVLQEYTSNALLLPLGWLKIKKKQLPRSIHFPFTCTPNGKWIHPGRLTYPKFPYQGLTLVNEILNDHYIMWSLHGIETLST